MAKASGTVILAVKTVTKKRKREMTMAYELDIFDDRTLDAGFIRWLVENQWPQNKLGNLSSAVALKMTFMGMLSKTYRKQLTYGQGLKDISKMTLELLDKANIFKTGLNERDIEVIFPSPIEEL